MAGHSDCCPQISTAEAQSQLNHAHKDRSWNTTKQVNTKGKIKCSWMASMVWQSNSSNPWEKHVWWISTPWCDWIISACIHEISSPLGLTVMKHEQHDKHHWHAWNTCHKQHVFMMQIYTFPCMDSQVAWWSKNSKAHDTCSQLAWSMMHQLQLSCRFAILQSWSVLYEQLLSIR